MATIAIEVPDELKDQLARMGSPAGTAASISQTASCSEPISCRAFKLLRQIRRDPCLVRLSQ